MSRDPGAVFDALGDAMRRRLITELSALGGATPTRLAAELPITRQAVSKHLSSLASAGLVTCERQGRETVYRVAPTAIEDAVSWMTEVGSAWDERLAALRRQLKRRRA